MFEGLDDIDWGKLIHAYGPAGDVAEMIRAINDDDPDVREQAFHAAFGNIFHQGTRYQATPVAVPFLLEILDRDDYRGRCELLYLLESLVVGYDSSYLPNGFHSEIAATRAEIETLLQHPEKMAQERAHDLAYGASSLDWLQWIVTITDEVAKGIPRYVGILQTDPTPKVRVGAAHLLSALPEFLHTFSGALRHAAQTDPDEQVRAATVFALAWSSKDRPTFEPFIDVARGLMGGSDHQEFGAAVALGTKGDRVDDEGILAVLTAAVRKQEDESRYFPWDQSNVLAALTLRFASDDKQAIVDALSAPLPTLNTTQAIAVTRELFTLVFETPFDGTLESLRNDQRDVLTVIANMETGWKLAGNFSFVMGDWGLPRSREKLRDFLAIEPSRTS